ncbi:MAG: fatty acid desaturase [Gemmataceae bacterium]|nr:fatty acid desaturase [Gemmata sp.]MDW8196484.1 fatty acid desaturase [Gemmataceae bacterium]
MSISLDLKRTLADPELKLVLQKLRKTDNFTNWWYLLRTYLYLICVIGIAVWYFENYSHFGLHWITTVPVAVIAIILVGTGQHQLTGLAHEGSHYILFRNRYLNDLAADILTMFPMFASIYHYRLQHLAHHQYVNDPDRDPDVSQLKKSGHWLEFPLSRKEVLRALIRQMSPIRLIRFMRIRAQYNSTGTDKNPYLFKDRKPSKTAVIVGVVYLVLLAISLTIVYYVIEDWQWLFYVAMGLWLITATIFLLLPADRFHQSKLRPVIPSRYVSIMRTGYMGGMLTSLAAISKVSGVPAVLYFVLLWIVPIFTSFAFFMILRQLVQHGNGGRGWINNTRTFLVAAPIRFAVFPLGQDYHLPHHMFATVPHYRLRKLHHLLLEYDEYREKAVEVHGYFVSPEKPQRHPTVLDVLGPDYQPELSEIHIDTEAVSLAEFSCHDGDER